MHQVWTRSRDVEFGGKQRISRWPGERRPGLSISKAVALPPCWMVGTLLLQWSAWSIEPQFLCNLLQAGKGQVDAPAEIAFGQFAPDAHIGIPVSLATLLAFFTCSIGAIPAMKGERGELTHPRRPGRAFRDDVQNCAARALMQFIGLEQG